MSRFDRDVCPPDLRVTVDLRTASSGIEAEIVARRPVRTAARRRTRLARSVMSGGTLQTMRTKTLSMPELILLAGTRVALGVGIGLLLAGRLERHARVGAGCALVAVGALTTIPLALSVMSRSAETEAKRAGPARVSSETRAGAEVP
jgi:hypothetical protein